MPPTITSPGLVPPHRTTLAQVVYDTDATALPRGLRAVEHRDRSLRHFVLEGWHSPIELHFYPISLWVRLR